MGLCPRPVWDWAQGLGSRPVWALGSQCRTRININILQPLCRGSKISLAGEKDGWVRFKYERLPNICYWCGRLTHSDRECSLWTRSRGKLKEGDQQFGSWIRATTPNPFRKTVIRVEGYDVEETEIGRGEGVEEESTNREKEKEMRRRRVPYQSLSQWSTGNNHTMTVRQRGELTRGKLLW